MRRQRNDELCGRISPIKFGQTDKTRNSKAIIRTWKQSDLRDFYKNSNNLLFYNVTILFQISNPKAKRRNLKIWYRPKKWRNACNGEQNPALILPCNRCVFFYIKNPLFQKSRRRGFFVLYSPGRLKNIVCFYMSFLIISRATTTPVTDACIKPRVIPAPSPIAYRLWMEVSKLFATSSFDE